MENNNKKKLGITITAAALALVIAQSNIVKPASKTFKYHLGENGGYVPTGTIDDDYLKDYYVLKLTNRNTNEEETYIARKLERHNEKEDIIIYENVFNGSCLLKSNNEVSTSSFVEETPLKEYLNVTQKVKSKYSVEDLEKILNSIEEEQKQSKKLVKTK